MWVEQQTMHLGRQTICVNKNNYQKCYVFKFNRFYRIKKPF